MTEEQQLKWLQALIGKGTNIGQINLRDGVQYLQVNVQGQPSSPQDEQETPKGKPEEETQDKPEEEISSVVPLAQSNLIFNPRLFTTEAHYERLRQAILAFVKHNEGCIPAHEYQIDPTTQAEWYFVLKAIGEARKVTRSGRLTDADFLRQMQAWFPTPFVGKDGSEEGEKMLRRYASSLSAERKKWLSGIDSHEVSIRDMFAHSRARGYEQARTLRLHGVAEGLRRRLEEISKSIT